MKSTDEHRRNQTLNKTLRIFIAVIVAGLGSILFYSIQFWSLAKFLSAVSVAIMVAGASLLAGGLVGFLFGIPRTLQEESLSEITSSSEPKNRFKTMNYRPNTNLEQISDWLTKILIGVGLTQIPQIRENLQRLVGYLAKGLGNVESSPSFALALLMYFLVCGFLGGYLLTRLSLASAFAEADNAIETLLERVEQAEETSQEAKKTSETVQKQVKEQEKKDAEALNLVNRQLNLSPGEPDISQEQLNEVIKGASPAVKVHIFSQAQDIRMKNWKRLEDKPRMERTIPIFKALVKSDPEQFHRNYGQLGFALKDKLKPEWKEAKAALSKAITLRGSGEKHRWLFLFYEFNRALCTIMEDTAFKEGQQSSPEVQKQVLDDLRAASRANYIHNIIYEDLIIKEWMEQNNITLAKLDEA